MKERTLSKKKTDALYEIVSNEIMDARIRIALISKGKDGAAVDNILSNLQFSAPQKAIDLFLKQTT